MKTTDLFKNNRSAKKLNESFEKLFGQRIDLAGFDLPKLEDARNKLRTQISQVRSQSGFNENVENEALTKAQWMLDAINAEIMEREEFVSDPGIAEVEESDDDAYRELSRIVSAGDYDGLYALMSDDSSAGKIVQDMYQDVASEKNLHADDDFEDILSVVMDRLEDEYGTGDSDEGGETDDDYALASAGFGSDEDYGYYGQDEGTEHGSYTHEEIAQKIFDDNPSIKKEDDILDAAYPFVVEMMKGDKKRANNLFNYDEDFSSDLISSYRWLQTNGNESVAMEKAPPGAKAERMVKHIKAGYAKDGKLTDKEKSIAYATAWKAHNKEKNESVKTGDDMRKLSEGEIQQAQSIVSAKTMVDRIGRWIEELSGMENDNLLQLGDQIRDEMGQDMAKQFLSSVAPAIQQALETLKGTRETLAGGVRILTGEEQGAEMIGAEPADALGGDEFGAEPDAMNAEPEADLGAAPEDEFAAAEPAAGGLGDAGREQRESIDYQNRLLKVLAG